MKFLFTVIFSVLVAVYANGKLHQLQSAAYVSAFDSCTTSLKTEDITKVYECTHQDVTLRVVSFVLSEEILDGH